MISGCFDKVTTLIAVLLATWLCHPTRAADNVGTGNVHAKLRLRHGIANDAPSLRRYLSSIAGDEESDKNPRRLIKELGDDDYYVRQAATRQLQRIPTLPQDLLEEAAQAPDPQVKWRAESLMLKRGRDGATVWERKVGNVSRLLVEHGRRPRSVWVLVATLVVYRSSIFGFMS